LHWFTIFSYHMNWGFWFEILASQWTNPWVETDSSFVLVVKSFIHIHATHTPLVGFSVKPSVCFALLVTVNQIQSRHGRVTITIEFHIVSFSTVYGFIITHG
ncbi:MAG: hypothetical protein ACO22R_09730, partial [Chitinophagaceae bacterium]